LELPAPSVTSSSPLARGPNVVGLAEALHRERCLQPEPFLIGSVFVVREALRNSVPYIHQLLISRLRRYADHVGIHYVLCSKLRQFSYEEIEFFLPQLCHLIISVDNESMALEEFILDLCEESVNGALLVRAIGAGSEFEDTDWCFRPFGFSKHTFTISRTIHNPKPSKHAEGYIIKSNI
jgi:hypothetical protein